jgi:putative endonuclease
MTTTNRTRAYYLKKSTVMTRHRRPRWTRRCTSSARSTLLNPVVHESLTCTTETTSLQETPMHAEGRSAPWYCYLLLGPGRTYVGATNNLPRRIRQHRGELAGGAKYTTRHGPWRLGAYALVGLKIPALRFEWRAKRAVGRNRLQWFEDLCSSNGLLCINLEKLRLELTHGGGRGP